MHDSRTFGRLCVGLLIAVMVGVIALSGWLLWPEWRKYQAVSRLNRDFEQLIANCDDDVSLTGDEYSAAYARAVEIRQVRGETLATEFLMAMLKHDCAKVRMYAAVHVEQIGPAAKEAVLRLIEALRDDNAVVRVRAAFALPELGTAANAAVPALIEAVQTEDPNVSAAAAYALRRIDRKIATEFATEHAEDCQLPPRVIDTLLHYDHEKALEGRKLAF